MSSFFIVLWRGFAASHAGRRGELGRVLCPVKTFAPLVFLGHLWLLSVRILTPELDVSEVLSGFVF